MNEKKVDGYVHDEWWTWWEKGEKNSEQAGGLTWVIPCEGLSSGDSTFKKQFVSC